MRKLLFFVPLAIVGYQLTIAMENGITAQQHQATMRDAQRAAQTHRDLYRVLGVDRLATTEQISSAYYRKRGQLYKRNESGARKMTVYDMKDLDYAYDILKNPEARAAYDRAVIDLIVR